MFLDKMARWDKWRALSVPKWRRLPEGGQEHRGSKSLRSTDKFKDFIRD
jgi:hypothetical protein